MDTPEDDSAAGIDDRNVSGGLPPRAVLGYYLFGYAICVLTLASDQVPPLALVVNSVLKGVLLALIFALGWGFLWVYLGSKVLGGHITFRDSQTLSGKALLWPGIFSSAAALVLAFLASQEVMHYAGIVCCLGGLTAVGVSAARVNGFGAVRDLLFLLWLPFVILMLVVPVALLS